MAKKSQKKDKEDGRDRDIQQPKSQPEVGKKAQVEKEKKEESVIFMGPHESFTEKKEDILLSDTAKKSLTSTTTKKHTHSNNKEQGGVSEMGRLVFGVAILFMGLVFFIQNIGLYEVVEVSFFDLWPPVLIFLGLLMLSKKKWWKIFSVFVLLFIVVIIGVLSFGSGVILNTILSGNVVSEERAITDVTSITFNGFGVLSVEQGESESLVITADETLLPKITAEVRDSELVISYNAPLLKLILLRGTPVTFHITVTDLERIELNGSGFIKSSGITSDTLEISIVGSGEAAVHMDVEEFIARISGSGTYTVSGNADRQIIHISGSGKYLGRDLISNETGVRISGSGDVEVNVQKELNASISGSGTVRYVGNPHISESEVSGYGSIEKLDTAIESEYIDLETLEKLQKIDSIEEIKIDTI